jgi:hypothetical protein
MWPFFGCVSFGPIQDGRCGNCWWTEKRCSWEDVRSGPADDPDPWAKGKAVFSMKRPGLAVSLMDWEVDRCVLGDLELAKKEQEQRFQAMKKRNSKT